MSEPIEITGVVSRLMRSNNILILSHKNPDGDTLGSAGALQWALKSYGKKVAVLCSDPIHERYEYMGLDLFKKQFEPEYIVAVDIAGPQLFGDALSQYADKVDLCIDHHGSNSGYADVMLLNENAAATCELVFDVITAMGVSIDQRIADCLYTGISTDTGCFRFPNTTAKTHQVAARLYDLGANAEGLNEILFETKTKARIAIEQYALQTLEYHFDGTCALICLTKEQIDISGVDMSDLEGITAMPKSIEGVVVGITMRQQPSGSFKISVRTRSGVDAVRIASGLGGGGHKQAAGCEIFGSMENAKEAILNETKRVMEEYKQENEPQGEK